MPVVRRWLDPHRAFPPMGSRKGRSRLLLSGPCQAQPWRFGRRAPCAVPPAQRGEGPGLRRISLPRPRSPPALRFIISLLMLNVERWLGSRLNHFPRAPSRQTRCVRYWGTGSWPARTDRRSGWNHGRHALGRPFGARLRAHRSIAGHQLDGMPDGSSQQWSVRGNTPTRRPSGKRTGPPRRHPGRSDAAETHRDRPAARIARWDAGPWRCSSSPPCSEPRGSASDPGSAGQIASWCTPRSSPSSPHSPSRRSTPCPRDAGPQYRFFRCENSSCSKREDRPSGTARSSRCSASADSTPECERGPSRCALSGSSRPDSCSSDPLPRPNVRAIYLSRDFDDYWITTFSRIGFDSTRRQSLSSESSHTQMVSWEMGNGPMVHGKWGMVHGSMEGMVRGAWPGPWRGGSGRRRSQ